MNADRAEQALTRIELAIQRIDAAVERSDAEAGDLAARHARLRGTVGIALRELDAMLAADPVAAAGA